MDAQGGIEAKPSGAEMIVWERVCVRSTVNVQTAVSGAISYYLRPRKLISPSFSFSFVSLFQSMHEPNMITENTVNTDFQILSRAALAKHNI